MNIYAAAALWLALAYDAIAVLYNKAYEYIAKTSGASEDTPSGDDTAEADNTDEVPEM